MIYDYIKNLTKIDSDQQVVNQVTWATVVKPKKRIPAPRGRGVLPFHMEEDRNQRSTSRNTNSNHVSMRRPRNRHSPQQEVNNTHDQVIQPNLNQPSTSRNTNSNLVLMRPPCNRRSPQREVNNTHDQVVQPNFAHITPSVREINGGWNTQSNEAIERRYKERQKQFAMANNDLSSDASSLNNTFTTISSETTESYKTTMQDSNELIAVNQEETSEGIDDKTLDRYKKNVLMIGLLRSLNSVYPENEETSTESSSEYLDTSGSIHIENGVANLSVTENDALRDYRVGMLFQSNEDEDVYYHPLKEQIQKNPEWQKLKLKRKGTEIVYSPREYYMNIDDDSFAFE